MKQDPDAADTEFSLLIIQRIPLLKRGRRFFYQPIDGGNRIFGVGGQVGAFTIIHTGITPGGAQHQFTNRRDVQRSTAAYDLMDMHQAVGCHPFNIENLILSLIHI